MNIRNKNGNAESKSNKTYSKYACTPSLRVCAKHRVIQAKYDSVMDKHSCNSNCSAQWGSLAKRKAQKHEVHHILYSTTVCKNPILILKKQPYTTLFFCVG